MAAARACRPGCPSRITAGHPCPIHTRKRWAGQPSRHQRGYGGEWDRVRREVLIRDGGAFEGQRLIRDAVCKYCTAPARTVDHRIPKAEGGTDDPGNLVACCYDCQKRKAGREGAAGQQRRRRGRGAIARAALVLVALLSSASCAPAPSNRYPFRVDCRLTGCPQIPEETVCVKARHQERYLCEPVWRPCICYGHLEEWCRCRSSEL